MADVWWGAHLLDRGGSGDTWAISRSVVTHRELRVKVDELRATFHAYGISSGSTVVVRMSPSFTYLQVLFALWSSGAQVILVDFRMAPAEYEPLLDLLEPQYVVRSVGGAGPAAGFTDEDGFVVGQRPSGKPADPEFCLVQFSSGSTGKPKVIGRSADSLLAELDRHAAMGDLLRSGDRLVILNSITHTMGLVTGVLHALDAGATVLLPPSQRPSDVLRVMARMKATAVFGVPAHFDLLNRARAAGELDLPEVPSLRLAVSGGECVPQETYDQFRQHFRLPIGQVYGVTETGLIAGEATGFWPPPAVGRPVPGVDVKLADGELYVHMDTSPYLYTDVPGRFADGWLRTYDRFEQDPQTGVLRILGRADSLAIVAGMNVDLAEVEGVLLQHSAVSDAVVMHDDAIEAFVAGPASLTTDELTAWCRGRLSPVKIPKRFFITRELPRNSVGKLIRNREQIHKELARATA